MISTFDDCLVRAGSSLGELRRTIESLGYHAFSVGRFALRPVTELTLSHGVAFCRACLA